MIHIVLSIVNTGYIYIYTGMYAYIYITVWHIVCLEYVAKEVQDTSNNASHVMERNVNTMFLTELFMGMYNPRPQSLIN